MARNKLSGVRLQLEDFPALSNINPDLYNQLLIINNAIQLLSSRVDQALGITVQPPDSIAQGLISVDSLDFATLNKAHTFYIRAAEAFTYGEVMAIGSDGRGYRANINDSNRMGRLIVTDQVVAANSIAQTSLMGVYKLPYNTGNMQVGTVIQAGTPGFIGRISAANIVGGRPYCGLVLSTDTVLFTGTLNTAYTS